MNYSIFDDNAEREKEISHEIGDECAEEVNIGGKPIRCRLFHKVTLDDQHEAYVNDHYGKVVRVTWQ